MPQGRTSCASRLFPGPSDRSRSRLQDLVEHRLGDRRWIVLRQHAEMIGDQVDVNGLILLLPRFRRYRIDIPVMQAEHEACLHIQDRSARAALSGVARVPEIVADLVDSRKGTTANGAVR